MIRIGGGITGILLVESLMLISVLYKQVITGPETVGNPRNSPMDVFRKTENDHINQLSLLPFTKMLREN